jgi:predicted transcriptional regulator of viral defense system
MMQTVDRVMNLFHDRAILRPRDLQAHGVAPAALSRLYRRGKLIRLGRGQYGLPDAGYTEHHSLAEACSRVPNGVVCLLSALQFHRLGTQSPFQVWMAVDRKARLPRVDGVPLRIVRFSGLARTEGVETHQIEGIAVHIYGPAKTVVDCFKYRHKIGLDVALEALRECRRQRRCTNDDLWRYATICRVANVMRPYLEVTT